MTAYVETANKPYRGVGAKFIVMLPMSTSAAPEGLNQQVRLVMAHQQDTYRGKCP